MGLTGETWFAGLTGAQQTSWVARMASDHVRWLRVDSAGSLSFSNDTLIRDARSAGINVDVVLQPWGLVTGSQPITNAQMTTMCTAQVRHYKAMGVETYEVFYEENSGASEANNGFTATQYAPLLSKCYAAIHGIDSSAAVLFGAMSQGPGNATSYLSSVYAWWTTNNQPGTHFTGLSVQAMDADGGMDQAPTSPADCPGNAWNPWVTCSSGNGNELSALRQILNANGGTSLPMWITKFGCASGTDGGYPADCPADATQATQITDAFSQANDNPQNEYGALGPALFLYDWIDTNSSNTVSPPGGGDDFGLYQANGAPKQLSLYAFMSATPAMPLQGGITPGVGGEEWFNNLSASQQSSWINTMVADHVRWLRLDSPGGGGFNSNPPNSVIPQFPYDTMISDAENAGINVDVVIEPSAMTGSNNSTISTSEMTTMCQEQVNHYEPMGVETYEVFNEPNGVAAEPDGFTSTQYEPLLAACDSAIKALDPSATVLLGSLSVGPGNASTWLSGVYMAGGAGHFDGVGQHPYVAAAGTLLYPTSPAVCPDDAWDPWVTCSPAGPSQMTAVRAVMNANGDAAVPIWITEFGCPTGTNGGYLALCTGQTLGQEITAAYQQANSNPGTEYGPLGPSLMIYEWIDNPDDDFGLYNADGTAKTPAVNAFKTSTPAS